MWIFRKLRNTSDGAERVMDTMQQMARSFSTRLVQMGMAYESTVESADNRNLFQKLQSYSQYPQSDRNLHFFLGTLCLSLEDKISWLCEKIDQVACDVSIRLQVM